MKITGRTKAILYKNDKVRLPLQPLSNIVGFLFNRNLINLEDDRYWFDNGNDYTCDWVKRYGRIYQEQDKIINKNYRIEIPKESDKSEKSL